mgnify:CR=1 FL=1
MKRIFTAVIAYDREDQCYDASVPDILGCATSGQTLEDAINQITDAANGCICALEDEGLPVPEANLQQVLPPDQDVYYTLVQVDTDKYRRMTNTRAVRKSVSVPQWMSDMAEKRGINCSQVLQDALREVFDRS